MLEIKIMNTKNTKLRTKIVDTKQSVASLAVDREDRAEIYIRSGGC